MNCLLSLFRISLAAIVLLPLSTPPQNPVTAAYDVSTVKPHAAGDDNMSWNVNENGFSAINVDLKNVISSAWSVRPDQIAGEPSWVDDLHWDITGKTTELTPEQLKKLADERRDVMMQQLLAERFHLKAHLETRIGTLFTLVPAKSGLKLQPILMTAEQKASGQVPGSGMRISGGQTSVMEAKKISLSMLLANLALNLHQTVIDKTGLPADAVYDFTLRWSPNYGTGAAADSDAPPLSAALQDQLGLHLETSRGPVQVLVVDRVERPTSN